ncbi:hypothetical protein AWC29_03470 [Mycobacterium triplex]|uniref:Uncharacterized protein n=1 Tax=Mycobacterium triplex TaxID=47839 RepID=A0A024K524_9MYCO|nr:hypothetical protein [Mycobacterium triplex]ORW98897.1 hypothetical protein AWC29_03470 [Mycobacterium triplex]CDO91145.1 hypothetical protein BN973_05551 [Mycobacterium triplex]
MNEARYQSGAIQPLGMVAGSLVAPVITPALIWATIAANLPLALVIVQLFAMAVFSNWVSRKLIHDHAPIEGNYHDHAMSKPWSAGPSNG